MNVLTALAHSYAASYAGVMREHIISEIQRLAALSGGQPPGNQAFVSTTGIIESKWRGKYWARWGDALIEAGFQPNAWTGKLDSKTIIVGVIAACRHYGRFPTYSELDMLRNSGAAIPASNTIKNNIGRHPTLIAAVRAQIGNDAEYADVLAMLPNVTTARPAPSKGSKPVDGHVYLIKWGEFYKIGCSGDLEKRVKEFPEVKEMFANGGQLVLPILSRHL